MNREREGRGEERMPGERRACGDVQPNTVDGIHGPVSFLVPDHMDVETLL